MSVLDRFRLDGRVALITGGARGLGRVAAQALAEAGAAVALTSRDLASAQSAADAIHSATGARALAIAADVCNSADVRDAVARTVETLGGLDILVNNAGINRRGPIDQITEEDWDAVIDTNLKGAWLFCKYALEPLKAKKRGRVINVSSMLGEVGLQERSIYASSKGGMTLLTKTLALEWAPHGINVNALCPGPFATEINTALLANPKAASVIMDHVPLARWGQPDELGPAFVFLAGDASSYMTGAVMLIDGGYTAR